MRNLHVLKLRAQCLASNVLLSWANGCYHLAWHIQEFAWSMRGKRFGQMRRQRGVR